LLAAAQGRVRGEGGGSMCPLCLTVAGLVGAGVAAKNRACNRLIHPVEVHSASGPASHGRRRERPRAPRCPTHAPERRGPGGPVHPSRGASMQAKPLYAALLAAAFAFPFAANAANDNSSSSPSASANSANDGGAEAMFEAMDKNHDGFISKEEARGTPHEAEFAQLDKNGDGKLSREEHYNAPEHVAAREKAGATGSTASSSNSKASSSGKSY